MTNPSSERDLVILHGMFAYVLSKTNGQVKVFVGPSKKTLEDTDRTVLFRDGKFRTCPIENACQPFIHIEQGNYAILHNPVKKSANSHPPSGTSSEYTELSNGSSINIQGPTSFALFPGQEAQVIKGHILCSNQYLVCRVTNEEAAKENWENAVMKTASTSTSKVEGEVKQDGDGEGEEKEIPTIVDIPEDQQLTATSDVSLTTGQRFIIKGTDISFFIPPTGIEVVPDEDGAYVRSAVTLQHLEYSILLDEDGNKSFPHGPAVVFPGPTQQFVTRQFKGNKTRKYSAIELNQMSGIYVKVIEAYSEETTNGEGKTTVRHYKEGEELFITGKDQMIYFPRKEHSIIRYGEEEKHFAVAIPNGQGRYVLNRNSGAIKTVQGPDMLLLDPRENVFVRRVLSEKQASLWFPGNSSVSQYNAELRSSLAAMGASPDGSGEYGGSMQTQYLADTSGIQERMRSYSRSVSNTSFDSAMFENAAKEGFHGNAIERRTTHTKPRTIQIDSAFEGAVRIDVWTGYAISVVNGKGERRIVQGPSNVLLQYDETLEKFSMSTGKPKTTDNLIYDVYLRVLNNKVADIVNLETSDMVTLTVKLNYCVDFLEAAKEKWFSVENYIKLLCDHTRSLLRNKVKQMTVEEFHANYIDIIRDCLLGAYPEKGKSKDAKRRGLRFEENGMMVTDVEVSSIRFSHDDSDVERLLVHTQRELTSAKLNLRKSQEQFDLERQQAELQKMRIELAKQAKQLETEKEQFFITANLATSKAEHAANLVRLDLDATEKNARNKFERNFETERQNHRQALAAKSLESELALQEGKNKVHLEDLARSRQTNELEINILKARTDDLLTKLKAESDAKVAAARAVQPGLIEALQAMSQSRTLADMVENLAPLAVVEGKSVGNVIMKLFSGTGFESTVKQLMANSDMSHTLIGSDED